MLINLYMLRDFLPFDAGAHLIADPVERTLRIAAISSMDSVQRDTLYILTPSDYVPGKVPLGTRLFFTEEPPPDPSLNELEYLYCLEPADRVGVLQTVYGVFQQFNDWELALLRALNQEDALQALGDCSLDMLRNPAGLYTASFFILRFWEKRRPGYTPLYQPEDRGTYIEEDSVNELLLSSRFVQSWYTTGPQLFPAMDGQNFSCLYENISLYGKNLARIVVNDETFPFRDSDFPILDFFSQFIRHALEADRTPYLTSHPPFLDETLLQLASGKPYDEGTLISAILAFGWKPEDSFVCARVNAPQDQSIGSIRHACMRLEAMLKGCCVLKTNEDIMMLVNLRTVGQTRDQVICSLPYLQREYLMKISYSYEFSGIQQLPVYYIQAGIAMEYGQKEDPHIWTYRFENYALCYCLRNASGRLDARSLCHPGLVKLLDYDRERGRNFSNTLRVYLENNMSVTQTIRKIYLQRASFQYQLQKIQEITDANLDDFETRLHILLSFRILDMERETEPS